MVIAVVCPECQALLTESQPHPAYAPEANMDVFICHACQLVIEPPTGIRRTGTYSPLSELGWMRFEKEPNENRNW